MKAATTIRSQLEAYLKNKSITLNQFSELTQINSGTLSGIINGHRPIAMQQLDRITAGMGLPEGHFYELYIDECFFQAAPDWRRLGPFLQRCAELNKLDCIEQSVRLMMDNLAYIPLLFNLAEQFFHENKWKAAAILYESIAESEQKQHSERLALCQYRLFTLGLSKDQNRNLLLALQFEHFVDRLDEPYQLDAIKDLINVFATVNRRDKVKELAEKLKVMATIHYELNGNKKPKETKKPIIFYIMYSYLELGDTYFHLKEYENALYYVSLYTDCSWVKEPNEDELVVIHQFQECAEGNRYLYQLMSGKVEILPEYLEYISTRENEVFVALSEIVTAANKFDMNIDFVLEQYGSHLKYSEQHNRLGKIMEQVTDDCYLNLLAGLGEYYLKKGDFQQGLAYVLDCFAFAIEIRSGYGILKCIGFFEQHRNFANEAANQRYKNLIGEVQKLNEKKIGFMGSFM
ncbi:MAG: helix-turn-helix transcriptional regulator [Paenibacillus macerans]|uniref:Putative helix-turn-helix domain protein n=1 Tax=Paenibacillus macerans TaxID=44252 RepID=A0A090Y779_PAEMA|nr:helix-turn-helix transcriptional regulator [Paenibacillus macerans]KFM94583.1 putative helix-turn-helix domain protein [Paenibacillus macerans]MCY7561178.1 helix-turn-helix transcriptional regulator [Paenibacillus macerans]MDU7472626.1 helix-turn-helix transcriptional regulator [Paenibacillus macerans]MEC0152137.1 helix-turn-helix transcriptional regulator [Paenibacillus macerans]MEC0332529.1 helix-turn-helix transcriptional regulator [Paenibacillus macerans]